MIEYFSVCLAKNKMPHPPQQISLVYMSSYIVKCVQQALECVKVFLDFRLGPPMSYWVAEKD